MHGVCAITALTAQNTRGVSAIHTAPRAMLRAQLDAVLGDFRVGAIKIGMLATPALTREVAAVLARHPRIPVVLDPVLVATTGAQLASHDLAPAVLRHLLARADLLTPNLPEAERLLGRRIATTADMHAAAVALRERGARAVLLKGGHLAGNEISDLLLTRQGEHWFHQRAHPRRESWHRLLAGRGDRSQPRLGSAAGKRGRGRDRLRAGRPGGRLSTGQGRAACARPLCGESAIGNRESVGASPPHSRRFVRAD